MCSTTSSTNTSSYITTWSPKPTPCVPYFLKQHQLKILTPSYFHYNRLEVVYRDKLIELPYSEKYSFYAVIYCQEDDQLWIIHGDRKLDNAYFFNLSTKESNQVDTIKMKAELNHLLMPLKLKTQQKQAEARARSIEYYMTRNVNVSSDTVLKVAPIYSMGCNEIMYHGDEDNAIQIQEMFPSPNGMQMFFRTTEGVWFYATLSNCNKILSFNEFYLLETKGMDSISPETRWLNDHHFKMVFYYLTIGLGMYMSDYSSEMKKPCYCCGKLRKLCDVYCESHWECTSVTRTVDVIIGENHIITEYPTYCDFGGWNSYKPPWVRLHSQMNLQRNNNRLLFDLKRKRILL